MAIRGRKPKPLALRVLAGEDCRSAPSPHPRRGIPERPDYLDAFGREAWDRLIPKLDELGILSEVDSEAIVLYCQAYSRWRLASLDIAKNGVTTMSAFDSVKSNPAVAVAVQAERMMASILTEFGMTPSSRSRVKVDTTSRDALGEFLSKGKG
jgi:P27 family predicted phage terminase small subunit